MANLPELIIRLRRNGSQLKLIEKSDFMAGAIDLQCVATESLVGAAAGSDWVDFDTANFVRGGLPRVYKALQSNPAIGCVHWNEGTIAANKTCWVRIWGIHEYANVDRGAGISSGSYIAVSASTAGVAVVVSGTLNRRIGRTIQNDVGSGTVVPMRVLVQTAHGIIF